MSDDGQDGKAATDQALLSQPVFKKKKAGPRRANAGLGAKSFEQEEEVGKSSAEGAIQDEDGKGSGHQSDEGTGYSLEDLVALRSMRGKANGISLDRLNKLDERKRKAKKKDEGSTSQQTKEEQAWAEQMQRGGLVKKSGDGSGSRDIADDGDKDADKDEAKSGARLLNRSSFQGETGTVDVDKHMMAFIEEEMRKRRAQLVDRPGNVDGGTLAPTTSSTLQFANAEDELYQIAEKYRQIQQSAKEAVESSRGTSKPAGGNAQDPEGKEEGNATLSTAMLTGVPEVDLGMEARMRNIEATERARKAMEDEERNRARSKVGQGDGVDDEVQSTRFFRQKNHARSDADSRAHFDEQNMGSDFTEPMAKATTGKRVDRATDELAVERFKKRQRDQLKR